MLAYIDDIVVFSKTYDEHLKHVATVLDALSSAGLTLSEKKCHFGYTDVKLLGHKVSRFGLETQREKVEAIMKLKFPTTVSEARTVFGEFGYHRAFMDEFAIVAEPLTSGLGLSREEKKSFQKSGKLPDPKAMKALGERPFEKTPARIAAFEALKELLSNAPILVHPDYDKPFILYTDACRKGIAAALYQKGTDGKEHPVLFISRTLRPAEKNYAATELECLAMVWSLKKLAHYVDGAQLTLVTDHSALKCVWNLKETVNQRFFRWSRLLNPLKDKITIVHRPGHLNSNVDPLSRFPVPSYATTITHIVISEEWKAKLQAGYGKDKHFRSIWKKLSGESPSTGTDAGTQTEGITMNLWVTTRSKKGEMTPQMTPQMMTPQMTPQITPQDSSTTTTPGSRDKIPQSSQASQTDQSDEFVQVEKELPILPEVGEKEETTDDGHAGLNLRLCIPRDHVIDIIRVVHSAVHLGIRKTFQAIASRYYFPQMSKSIASFVNRCGTCHVSKPSHDKVAGKLQPIRSPPVPYHTISIDFVTGLHPFCQNEKRDISRSINSAPANERLASVYLHEDGAQSG